MKLIKTTVPVPMPAPETTHTIDLTDNELRNLIVLLGTATTSDMLTANERADDKHRFTEDVSFPLYGSLLGIIK
jgi:hypothetical protein